MGGTAPGSKGGGGGEPGGGEKGWIMIPCTLGGLTGARPTIVIVIAVIIIAAHIASAVAPALPAWAWRWLSAAPSRCAPSPASTCWQPVDHKNH